jgi:hypothetical protein
MFDPPQVGWFENGSQVWLPEGISHIMPYQFCRILGIYFLLGTSHLRQSFDTDKYPPQSFMQIRSILTPRGYQSIIILLILL